MIRINLLGKKAIKGPLGIDFDELLAKVGYQGKASDLFEYKWQVVKIALVAGGLYAASVIPDYWLQQELAKTDAVYAQLEKQMQTLQQELESKKTVRAQMAKLVSEETEVRRQLNIITNLGKNREDVFNAIERIGGLLPDGAWLESLDLNDDKIRLQGAAWDYSNISDLVRVLSENVTFSGIQLQGITAVDIPNPVPGVPKALQKTKTFTVEMNWKGKSG